jgi:hypothetical protein
MSLVIIRCGSGSCRGTLLGSLDDMPTDWTGSLTVLRCRKCVIPSPRRILKVLGQKKATGFALTVEIPLADLRPYAEKAAREQRAETVRIPPIYTAD